ncbi:HYC_CC_PP family protein [Flavihumibacter profundi]|uniref:HYC_CC_PP family protein n=1 Tax=Flavihumibacter profundi TaxID=2716883 RepID=UPI001CC3570A|nr:hypothetical protein [Flavihumibacter profundi]MBZ5858391.1 hypothetical protein [Flavihumibacter profundi]
MRKFITAILAILYLATSTGAVINMHYCMGEMTDWDLSSKASKNCQTCGMEKSDKKGNHCCKDEIKFVKNNTDQKSTEASFHFAFTDAVAIPVSFIEIPTVPVSSLTVGNPNSHAPPQRSSIGIYILDRSILV